MKKVILCTASWCKWCKQAETETVEYCRHHNIEVEIKDVDENQALVDQFNLSKVPYVIFYKKEIPLGDEPYENIEEQCVRIFKD